MINSATYVIGNSTSCINLIFAQQPNLVTSSGVQACLHNNCHHQIIFTHINLLIEHPQPYHRLVWEYSNADILNIRKSISSVNLSHLFSDNHIDIQASIFEECVLNFFKSFVPNECVVFDDKELLWMDQSIKQRDSFFSKYQNEGHRDEDLHIVTSVTDKINEQIFDKRKSYFLNHSNQLNDKCLNTKKCWSLLRSFLQW